MRIRVNIGSRQKGGKKNNFLSDKWNFDQTLLKRIVVYNSAFLNMGVDATLVGAAAFKVVC